jgi:hypothetical protein
MQGGVIYEEAAYMIAVTNAILESIDSRCAVAVGER